MPDFKVHVGDKVEVDHLGSRIKGTVECVYALGQVKVREPGGDAHICDPSKVTFLKGGSDG